MGSSLRGRGKCGYSTRIRRGRAAGKTTPPARLDFRPRPADNAGVMRGIEFRILVAVCTVSLASPPGWCCYVVPTPCCSVKAEQAKTSATGQAKPKCPHCCATDDSAPQPRPAQRPGRPEKSAPHCCCDRLPAAPRNAEQKTPPPVAALSASVAAAPPTLAATPRWTAQEPSVIPVQLHVIHCLWLC